MLSSLWQSLVPCSQKPRKRVGFSLETAKSKMAASVVEKIENHPSPELKNDISELEEKRKVSPQKGNPRNKVALKPGRSLMDWVKLTNASSSLSGVERMMAVTPEELAKHSSPDDIWVALRGYVYNVTPYLEYHPGGLDELMRGAGRDCTDLFDEVHRWVNFESMLKKCMVGKLKPSPPTSAAPSTLYELTKELRPSLVQPKKSARPLPTPFLVPPGSVSLKVPPSTVSQPTTINYDWHESPGTLEISLFTKMPGYRVTKNHVIVDNEEDTVRVFVATPAPTPSKKITRIWHKLEVKLKSAVEKKMTINVSPASGKVTLFFRKIARDRWGELGEVDFESPCESAGPDEFTRRATLERVSEVTPDMKVFEFRLPAGCFLAPPLGSHVYLKTEVLGMGVVKAYTPIVPYINSVETDSRTLNGSTLSFMIKVYKEGMMTSTLSKLKRGESVEITNFDGTFEPEKFWEAPNVALIAAGSGVTPMIRLLAELFAGKDDLQKKKSWIGALLCNRTEKDIPWADSWKSWEDKYSSFKVQHLLSQPDSDWSGLKGRISETVLKNSLPPKSSDSEDGVYICICGSNAFNDAVKTILTNMGYSGEEMFIFDG